MSLEPARFAIRTSTTSCRIPVQLAPETTGSSMRNMRLAWYRNPLVQDHLTIPGAPVQNTATGVQVKLLMNLVQDWFGSGSPWFRIGWVQDCLGSRIAFAAFHWHVPDSPYSTVNCITACRLLWTYQVPLMTSGNGGVAEDIVNRLFPVIRAKTNKLIQDR